MEPGERLARRLAGLHRKASPGRFDQDDGVHGPPVSLARRPEVVHLLSISTRVIRPSNVMVTSACDRGTAPSGATTPQTGGFERLRLRPHQKPTCSLGTRRDTSRRCGGLAPVPSASVVLHPDAHVSNPST